jgi:hypothetical protein
MRTGTPRGSGAPAVLLAALALAACSGGTESRPSAPPPVTAPVAGPAAPAAGVDVETTYTFAIDGMT